MDNKRITDYQEVSEYIKKEKEWVDKFIELAQNIIVVIDENGKIVLFNAFAEKLTGYKSEEVIGRSWIDVFIPERMKQELHNVFNSVVENKPAHHRYENPIITKKGEEKIISWSNAALTRDDKFDVVLSIGEDITERKGLEELVLKEKQEQETMLDAIPAWMFYKDRENHYVHVNNALANVLGVPKKDLEGKSMFDIFPKEQAEKFFKDDKEVLESGNPKRNIIEQMTSPQGNYWVQTDKIPFKDDHGNIIGIIGFAIDITNRKRAEEKTKNNLEELTKFKNIMIGRELKMVELKAKIENLTSKKEGKNDEKS